MSEPKGNNEGMIYGINPVMEALEAGKEFERIFIQRDANSKAIYELVSLASSQNAPVSKVPVWKLNKLVTKNHQGVVGYMASVSYASLDHIVTEVFARGESPLVVLLDRVTDVRNFGAIARTAECAGAHALVVPEKGGAQIGSDALKTSAGALNHLPVCREASLLKTVKYLKNSGLTVVAATEKASKLLYEVDMSGPMAIILGSEEDGVSAELLREATELARIPMGGKINSLNVSVAGGIAIFEAVRQRNT